MVENCFLMNLVLCILLFLLSLVLGHLFKGFFGGEFLAEHLLCRVRGALFAYCGI